MPRMRLSVVGALLTATVLLTGTLDSCAGQQAASTPGVSTTAGSAPLVPTSAVPITTPLTTTPLTTTFPTSTAPNTSAPTAIPTSTVAPGRRLTLTGTVEAGVEHGCLLLTDEATGLKVNLTGGAADVVKAGARIKVVGVIRRDMMSYCQQGAIFEVFQASAH